MKSEGVNKFSGEASGIMSKLRASGVILIVFGGDKKSGAIMQLNTNVNLEGAVNVLRRLASQIEKDHIPGGVNVITE